LFCFGLVFQTKLRCGREREERKKERKEGEGEREMLSEEAFNQLFELRMTAKRLG